MSISQAYSKYINDAAFTANPRVNCDCDFHQGRNATPLPYLTSNARFGKPGDSLPPGFCNSPSRPTVTDTVIAAAVSKTGHNCMTCNSRNECAASNRPGGKYMCFNCR